MKVPGKVMPPAVSCTCLLEKTSARDFAHDKIVLYLITRDLRLLLVAIYFLWERVVKLGGRSIKIHLLEIESQSNESRTHTRESYPAQDKQCVE
jgi:hypothetical protein